MFSLLTAIISDKTGGMILGICLLTFTILAFYLLATEDDGNDRAYEADKKRFDRELAAGNPNPRVPSKINYLGSHEFDSNRLAKTQRFKDMIATMQTNMRLVELGAATVEGYGFRANNTKIKELIAQGILEIKEGRIQFVKKDKDP